MEKVLDIVELESTTEVLKYVESHAQNKEMLRVMSTLAMEKATTYYTILPAQEPFAREDIKELSVGWRIFPPEAKKLREARTSLLENMFARFLAMGDNYLCLLPCEFLPSNGLLGSKLTFVYIDNYPYVKLDRNSDVDELRFAQNTARGFLYNCLLLETSSKPNLSIVGSFGDVRCVILEAYDGDSYLMIVPQSGKRVMNEIFHSLLQPESSTCGE